MSLKLKSLEIVFEDCEFCEISAKYIGQILIGDTKNKFAFDSVGTSFYNECDKIVFEFMPEANKIENLVHSSDFHNTYDNVFKRLMKYKDITSFILHFENGGERSYLPVWKDEDHNGMENIYQHHYLSKNNCLYVVIGKDFGIEDIPMWNYLDDDYYLDSENDDEEGN